MEKRNNTEFYLNLYQKFHKSCIEEVIDDGIDELLLEKYYYGQKIDIFGKIVGTPINIFIESMIGKSNEIHLKFILNLIDMIDKNQESIIIFEAQDFTGEIIETILCKIRESEKAINFYSVQLNEEFVGYMEGLNNIHELRVIDRIREEIDIKPFGKIEKYITIAKMESSLNNKERIISRVEERNIRLIKELRRKLCCFLNIYREKSTLANRILTYGAGRSNVYYCLSVESEGKTFICVKFDKAAEYIYNNIKKKKKEFRNAIDCNATFDDKELTIRSDIKRDYIFKDTDILADVFQKYVFYLSNDILYLNQDGSYIEKMVNQHHEGIL